jgi:opacity protein-like surface antigen
MTAIASSWMRRVAAGAVLATAALSATAATVQATPTPAAGGNGVIGVRYFDAPGGLRATIWDHSNPDGATETCYYQSNWAGTGLISFNGSVVLNGQSDGSLFIPGDPLGKRWNVTLNCGGTGQSANFWVTY